MRRGLRGFTIIELIVVMTIIIILAGFLAVSANKARERALIARTRSMIAAIETGLEMFRTDLGGYPSSAGNPNVNLYSCLTQNGGGGSYVIGTTTFALPNANWSGPYMTFKDADVAGIPPQIIDAWGTTLTYTNPDTTHGGNYVDIGSNGPNKAAGGGDDITNWTK